MATEKSLKVKILGDTTDLETKLKSSAASLVKWGAAASAAAAMAGFALIKSGIESVDALAKQSRSLNMTSKDLLILQRAADLSGVSSQQLTTAMRTLTIGLGQAAQGTGTAKDTLKQLGVSLDDLDGMGGAEKLGFLTQKIKETIPASQQAAAMADLFGSRAALAMSNLSSDDITTATEQVKKFKLELSEVELAAVEAADDAMSQFGSITQSVTQRLAVQFAPTITAVSDLLADAASESGLFKDGLTDLAEFGTSALGVVADGVQTLYTSILGLQSLFNKISGNVSALQAKGKASALEQLNGMDEKEFQKNKIIFGDAGSYQYKNLQEARIRTKQELDAYVNDFAEADEKLAKNIENIKKLTEGKLFSEIITDKTNEKKGEAEQTGKQRERDYQALSVASVNEVTGEDEDSPEVQKAKEDTERILEDLRNRFKTEQELQAEKYLEETDFLAKVREEGLISEAEYLSLKDELNKEYADKEDQRRDEQLQKDREAQQAKLNTMKSFFGNLTALMDGESKKQFQVGKIAAMGEAAITGYQAVLDAYGKGVQIGGPPVGVAFAAAAGIATAMQIQKIASAQYGGSGSSVSGGMSHASDPNIGASSDVAPVERTIANITLQGSNFSRDSVVVLMEQINELKADGVRLL